MYNQNFLNKIMNFSKKSALKLFIDLKGQEVMIINSGEKEYFELSDYNRESIENGSDEVENLYNIWNNIDDSSEKGDILECALE